MLNNDCTIHAAQRDALRTARRRRQIIEEIGHQLEDLLGMFVSFDHVGYLSQYKILTVATLHSAFDCVGQTEVD